MDSGSNTVFNNIQRLKRRFFAMRNGALGESMRKSGAPYRIIFGLNLPQICEIAGEFDQDKSLALQLRDNTSTRESMLIAPMLFPVEELNEAIALEWLQNSPTTEVIDVACLKLIKKLDNPAGLLKFLAKSDRPLLRYAAIRLGANILPREIELVEQIAREEAERNDPMTRMAARMVVDDIEFRRDEC